MCDLLAFIAGVSTGIKAQDQKPSALKARMELFRSMMGLRTRTRLSAPQDRVTRGKTWNIIIINTVFDSFRILLKISCRPALAKKGLRTSEEGS